MKSKRVLAVIGAGEAALPILNKAREMGVETIAFGQADSIAKDSADHFCELSVFDLDNIELECRELSVNGIIASSEITTESAAILAERLSLPGNKCKPFFFGRNKYYMREMIKSAKNVKQPSYYLYQGIIPINYPVMVKAVDACGKRGISLVNNKEEFFIALKDAKNNSSNNNVLIEEYIENGREVSVECLADGKDKYIIQITDKISSGPPHFTEIAHHQPAQIDENTKCRITNASKEILSLLGIECGMAHLELKIVGEELFFIEVGARAGGDHIADTLVGLSTDYDYYKGAIECCFGQLQPVVVNNVAYSGILFHCYENKKYKHIFDAADSAKWCFTNNVNRREYINANGNVETAQSGYIIYRSDHKLFILNSSYTAELINEKDNAFELIWNHNKEIGRSLSDEELKTGIKKFLDKGNVISIIQNKKIIGFLMLYCNNYETLEAYICNVYVLDNYRGLGLSKLLMEKAIEICLLNGFQTIKLHVAEDNYKAINLYRFYGFKPNGIIKMDEEKQIEMIKLL